MDKEFFEIANRLGACRLLHGTESKEELMRLLLTPQGTEFCTKNNFPSMEQLREFKGKKAESMGIYIDTDVELTNPVKVFLAGSKAVLHFDTIARYNVILMHGATAEIHASNYAVVFVKNAGGEVEVIKDNIAKVL
ncbi:hypothetical protein [uncultured Parabacteroides sp.]|uniref:hypothetical protein n=1 Tax=uncultured Parabacteroides sp. TaxID=512312 RepID=UPI0025DEC690|nr:hypothetical protein [uncultured Parabacteroides sp.]